MVSVSEIKAVFSSLEASHQPTMLEQLDGCSPFQLLIATLASSRTKDTLTIPIVKKLFQNYRTPQQFIAASTKSVEEMLYGVGFYKTKARQIKLLSRMLLDEFEGNVPQTIEQLTSLSGVGRKTANCILNYAFQKPAIGVDVHVQVIVNRLGWINTKKPKETEFELQKVVPKPLWIDVNRLFVHHGQNICLTKKPRCNLCPISKHCHYFKEHFKSYQ